VVFRHRLRIAGGALFFLFDLHHDSARPSRAGRRHHGDDAINTEIVRSLFMPFFLGTTLSSLALAILALFRLDTPAAAAIIAGGLIYVVGMFVVTAVFNVPLNNALAAVDPASAEAAGVWARYLNDWTLWNDVRTISSTVACALFIAAIAPR
jgi:uncharacterized membrane protein